MSLTVKKKSTTGKRNEKETNRRRGKFEFRRKKREEEERSTTNEKTKQKTITPFFRRNWSKAHVSPLLHGLSSFSQQCTAVRKPREERRLFETKKKAPLFFRLGPLNVSSSSQIGSRPVPADSGEGPFVPACAPRRLKMTATRDPPCHSRKRGPRHARGAAKAAATKRRRNSIGVAADAAKKLLFFSCLASLGLPARAQPQLLAAMALTVIETLARERERERA